ncbi:MAG: hypothetical protein ABIN58_00095 [candidate division WOR-3 bacterium]|jgi:hypothetical protein
MKRKTPPFKIAPTVSYQVISGRELIRKVIFHPLLQIAERIEIPLDIQGKKKKRRHKFVNFDPLNLKQETPAWLSPETFQHSPRAHLVRVVKRGKGPHLVVSNKVGLSWAWRWDQKVLVDPIISTGSLLDDQLSTLQEVVYDILTPSPWAPASYLDEYRIRFLLTLEGHLPCPNVTLSADPMQHQAFLTFIDTVRLGGIPRTNGAQDCPDPKSRGEAHQHVGTPQSDGSVPVGTNERRIQVRSLAFPGIPLEGILHCFHINPRTYSEARKRILINSSAARSEASS